MYPCTLSQLVAIISGTSVSEKGENVPVLGVSIDSRDVRAGDAFFALPGSRSHGILFADEAVARGAACVVTDSAAISPGSDRPTMAGFRPSDTIEIDNCIIRVPDALAALQNLAAWNRKQSSALVTGITGSVGKTTTRQMIATVLNEAFQGQQSPRNYNNEIGLPLSLLELQADDDFAVLELGAGRAGDIAKLAELCRPEFAVVTRVAPAHLESFGSLEKIRRTKQELVESLPSEGIAFLNADDPDVRQMARATRAAIVLFGLSPDADVYGQVRSAESGVCRIAVDGREFCFQGARHLASSALAAVAVGKVTGLSPEQIASGLSKFCPDAGRGRVALNFPWTVIDDSYNASPASVSAAISSLQDWRTSRRRFLVLGDMLELGEESVREHYEVGRALIGSSVDHVLAYGAYAEDVARGARSVGLKNSRVSVFRDLSTMQAMLDCMLNAGDVVLIKGSRSMQMERVVDWLCRHAASQRFTA